MCVVCQNATCGVCLFVAVVAKLQLTGDTPASLCPRVGAGVRFCRADAWQLSGALQARAQAQAGHSRAVCLRQTGPAQWSCPNMAHMCAIEIVQSACLHCLDERRAPQAKIAPVQVLIVICRWAG